MGTVVELGGTTEQVDSIEVLESQICLLAGQIAAATAQYLLLLADFDERRGWTDWQVRSCAHWLSWKVGVGLHAAREQVRVARALTTLPKITAAFAAGTISYSKVRAMTRVANEHTEQSLLDLALSSPAAHLDRICRGLLKAMRPTKPNGVEWDNCTGRWMWDEDDGSLVLTVRLRPEDGARMLAAITVAEYERTRTDDSVDADLNAPAPHNPVEALLAMADMVCSAVESPVVSPSAEVIVHMDGEDAHLDNGPGLDAETLAQILCTAVMRRVSHGQLGNTIEWNTSARTPNRTQMRALLMRDRCCCVPGCGRTRFLHAHHVTYFSNSGPTHLDNLIMLCGEHHRALHDGYFAITALGGQRFSFHHPDGLLVEYAPAVSGVAADLTAKWDLIEPEDIQPTWYGEGLDLSYSTDVLIRNWERDSKMRAAA